MERLFVYGSLQPGGPNAYILDAIAGEWEPASIKGNLIEAGWGASMGYPGLVLNENGCEIQGHVFSSENLINHWADLDKFEGQDYDRVLTSVTLISGVQVQAHVYITGTRTPCR
ncbi:MAG: gamma-glutamylcyclotransferase [Cyanobacteria bacterium P01_F01_bin.150]